MSSSEQDSRARLLITGATGFIGSRLALHAHRLGFDVLATGRADSDVELERLNELKAAKVRTAVGLLQDERFTAELTADRDAVVHLAAAQHEAGMPDSYFRSVNIDAVRILLDACRRSGVVRRFVYGGTMGVFGSSDANPLDEQSPTAPDNIYTRTKLEAEGLVRARGDAFETCIVRIGEVYGPGDHRLLKLFRAIDRGRFFMIGAGENRRQCIHVNDLVRGLMLAALHPAASGETFIFAGPETLTTNEMVRDIAAVLERPAPRWRAPLWPFVLAARILETTAPLLSVAPPLHSRRLDFFRKSFVLSAKKARTVLGFEPQIDFLTGAADAVRWYRAHGYLPVQADGLTHTESV